MKIWGIIGTAVALAGCTSITGGVTNDPNAISNLSNEIECELETAFSSIAPKNDDLNFRTWTVTYTITNNVEDSASLSVDVLKWVIPANIDRLVLGGGGRVSRVSTRNAKAEFSLNLARGEQCSAAQLHHTNPSARPKFRVRDWAEKIANSTRIADSFGYSLEVVTDRTAGITPDIEDGRVSGAATLAGGSKFKQTVDFAFSPIAGPPEAILVTVTNFPSGGGAAITGKGIPARVRPKETGVEPATRQIPFQNLQQNRAIIQQLQIDRINNNR